VVSLSSYDTLSGDIVVSLSSYDTLSNEIVVSLSLYDTLSNEIVVPLSDTVKRPEKFHWIGLQRNMS
jgi:hypothetical protein